MSEAARRRWNRRLTADPKTNLVPAGRPSTTRKCNLSSTHSRSRSHQCLRNCRHRLCFSTSRPLRSRRIPSRCRLLRCLWPWSQTLRTFPFWALNLRPCPGQHMWRPSAYELNKSERARPCSGLSLHRKTWPLRN